jgi:hypothetical protein
MLSPSPSSWISPSLCFFLLVSCSCRNSVSCLLFSFLSVCLSAPFYFPIYSWLCLFCSFYVCVTVQCSLLIPKLQSSPPIRYGACDVLFFASTDPGILDYH